VPSSHGAASTAVLHAVCLDRCPRRLGGSAQQRARWRLDRRCGTHRGPPRGTRSGQADHERGLPPCRSPDGMSSTPFRRDRGGQIACCGTESSSPRPPRRKPRPPRTGPSRRSRHRWLPVGKSGLRGRVRLASSAAADYCPRWIAAVPSSGTRATAPPNPSLQLGIQRLARRARMAVRRSGRVSSPSADSQSAARRFPSSRVARDRRSSPRPSHAWCAPRLCAADPLTRPAAGRSQVQVLSPRFEGPASCVVRRSRHGVSRSNRFPRSNLARCDKTGARAR